MKKNHLIIPILSLVFLFSCTDQEAEKTKSKEVKKGIIEVDTTDVFSSEQYDFVLPRPFALAANFEEAGMKYDKERMNPTENVVKYKTKGDQLINFGVYSTDLVYNILNDQPQQTMAYFNTLKELADKFGMGSIFTEDELAIKIEQNISDRSVLEDLLVDVHERSQEFLEDNDMRYLSAIQFSGAWIEGMYLASFDFVEKEPSEVSHKIVDQMSLLRNALKGLNAYPNKDESIKKTIDALEELQETYNNFDSLSADGGTGLPELSADEIKEIAKQIQEIRSQIIKA